MATRKVEKVEKVEKVATDNGARFMDSAHRFLWAYMGAFGMAGDEFVRLFNLFVKRGERMEKDVRKLVKEAQKEQAKVTVRAEKAVKKAVKRVEAVA
jgi:hypothetical protein